MAGIVRRIDDLGRIVIPKEIRRSLKVKNGEALDIEIVDNKIVLKKYSNFLDIQNILDTIVFVAGKNINKDILVFDRNSIVSQYEKNINNLIGKDISEELFDFIVDRKVDYMYEGDLKITKDIFGGNFYITSIVPNGDVVGGIIIYSKEEKFNDNDKIILDLLSKILEKYIEE